MQAYTIRLNFKNRFSEFDFEDILAIKNRLNGTDYITHTDEKRLKEGRVGGQFWAVSVYLLVRFINIIKIFLKRFTQVVIHWLKTQQEFIWNKQIQY